MSSDPLTPIHGDALSSLRTLADGSVQCCVTSPPYWGLRDYGTGTWEGGDPACEHTAIRKSPESDAKNKQGTNAGSSRDPIRSDCRLCGARRIDVQIGLEKTPSEYVSRLVEIFREVRRVLMADGTCWLNLGDSYCASPKGSLNGQDKSSLTSTHTQEHSPVGVNKRAPGLKPKDLVGIPWMVAFALRSDGWYLRSDIIWSKPNPMPESVTDRPTKSHEYIFLLSRCERYHFDNDAVRVPYSLDSISRYESPMMGTAPTARQPNGDIGRRERDKNLRDPNPLGRNIRTVWTVTTQPFSGAHFATFPPDLIKPCILAGAPVGGVVLDPFAGSGTTGKVAIELGRRAILIEPKAEYVEMIKRRCQTTIGLPLAI